jgi:predicted RNA-binding Zn-ribbon protein involved in translation (DUF1610 family)
MPESFSCPQCGHTLTYCGQAVIPLSLLHFKAVAVGIFHCPACYTSALIVDLEHSRRVNAVAVAC